MADRLKLALGGLGPFLVLGILVFYVLGPGNPIDDIGTPLPNIFFEQVIFEPEEILVSIRNTGLVPVDVIMADVNDRIQPSAIEPQKHLERFETAKIRIPFSWNEAEPYNIGVTIQDGTRFSTDVEAASSFLQLSVDLFLRLGLIGVYVGIIPILIGMLWIPFIRKAKSTFGFFLALTLGLLLFLAVDSVIEATDVVDKTIPEIFDGLMLIVIGMVSSFLILHFTSFKIDKIITSSLGLALMIAIGIGVHNFAEGLAIGAAISLGSIGLGTFLIAGFMIHNSTEGIAIASAASKRGSVQLLIGLGLLAGSPAILGTWIGGFTFSPILSVVFLSIGAGALFQVSYSILMWLRKDDHTLSSFSTVGGIILGLVVMYVTSIII